MKTKRKLKKIFDPANFLFLFLNMFILIWIFGYRLIKEKKILRNNNLP
jgi:hypothetical protein